MLHRPFLKRTAVLQVAENILTLCNEPRNLVRVRSPKKKNKQVNLLTVPLDVLPEHCTLTMLPEIPARRSLPA